MRIVVQAPDLEPGRTKSHAVANYVRAVIKLQALRQEFAEAVLEVQRCKQALSTRVQAGSLLAEAHALCEALGIENDAR